MLVFEPGLDRPWLLKQLKSTPLPNTLGHRYMYECHRSAKKEVWHAIEPSLLKGNNCRTWVFSDNCDVSMYVWNILEWDEGQTIASIRWTETDMVGRTNRETQTDGHTRKHSDNLYRFTWTVAVITMPFTDPEVHHRTSGRTIGRLVPAVHLEKRGMQSH